MRWQFVSLFSPFFKKKKSVNRYTINYYDHTHTERKRREKDRRSEKHSIGYGITYITKRHVNFVLFFCCSALLANVINKFVSQWMPFTTYRSHAHMHALRTEWLMQTVAMSLCGFHREYTYCVHVHVWLLSWCMRTMEKEKIYVEWDLVIVLLNQLITCLVFMVLLWIEN